MDLPTSDPVPNTAMHTALLAMFPHYISCNCLSRTMYMQHNTTRRQSGHKADNIIRINHMSHPFPFNSAGQLKN